MNQKFAPEPVRCKSDSNYFGPVRVNGKLIRRSKRRPLSTYCFEDDEKMQRRHPKISAIKLAVRAAL
jgi:hypothetical protein